MLQKKQLVKKCQKIFFLVINFLLIYYDFNFLKKDQKITFFHNHIEYCNKRYNDLAFSFAGSEKFNPLLDLKQIRSQEIIITGIENYELQDKLISLLGIPIVQNQIISNKNIEKIISKMKLSGFFTNIDVSNQCIHSHQSIYINVTINSILKSVNILDFPNKLVSKSDLVSLFINQIGYPVNFLELDKSIDSLKRWYHVRGYKWAKVYILNNPIISENITIKISEGIITKIEIAGYTKDYNLHNLCERLPIMLILETLNIKPHKVLNIQNLDSGIIKLKNKKVIVHCYYDIIHANDDTLTLLLNLELLDDRYTYLFSKNVSITSSLLESMELLLQYSLNHLFYNNNYSELNVFNNIANLNSNNINYLFHPVYLNMSDHDIEASQLLKPKKIISRPYINEWCLTQLIFIAGDNFGFRHYMRNIGQQNSNYFLDVRFPQTGPYFNIKYEQPWIRIYNNTLSQFSIRLYKDTYTFQKNFIPILLDQLNDSIFYYKNSILSQNGISFECKHDLSQSTHLLEHMSFKKIAYQYLLLHNSIIWPNLGSNFYCSAINSYNSYFKQVWISNIQEVFQLDINLIFSKLNTSCNSNEFGIELSNFIPKKNNQAFYRLPIKLNYGNKIRMKIINRYNIMNHILYCESELLTFIGRVESLPFSERFLVIGPDIIRGYNEEIFQFPFKFAKVKLEYHIKLASYNAIFIFLDYAQNINWQRKFHNYSDNLLFSPYSSNRFNEFQTRLGYGIGLQINTPIKQIPPLRLEYGYNIHNGKCLHLRLDKQ